MDYKKLKSFNHYLQVYNIDVDYKIKEAIRGNEQRNELNNRIAALDKDIQWVEDELHYLKLFSSSLTNQRNIVKEERLTHLEDSMSADLAEFFGESQYKVRFVPYESYGKERMTLQTRSSSKDWTISRVSEGGFVRQELGISIVTIIALMVGCDFLLLDEVLSNADVVKRKKLNFLLRNILDKDMNVIYIEHSKEAYNTFENRREIYLDRDEVTNITKVREVVDY